MEKESLRYITAGWDLPGEHIVPSEVMNELYESNDIDVPKEPTEKGKVQMKIGGYPITAFTEPDTNFLSFLSKKAPVFKAQYRDENARAMKISVRYTLTSVVVSRQYVKADIINTIDWPRK